MLRPPPQKAMPLARPQGRQSLNVSLSHPVSMSRCLNVSAGLGSQVSGLSLPFTTTHCPAARWTRRWQSGHRRADMRPETRDLPGGHETLRPPVGEAAPGACPFLEALGRVLGQCTSLGARTGRALQDCFALGRWRGIGFAIHCRDKGGERLARTLALPQKAYQ